MRYIRLFLILIIFSATAFAGEITPIKQGSPSPYDGFVITKDFEKDIRQINEESKLLKHKNVLLSDLSVTHRDMVALHKGKAKKAYSELLRAQFKSYLWFFGGIIIGGGALYLGSKIR